MQRITPMPSKRCQHHRIRGRHSPAAVHHDRQLSLYTRRAPKIQASKRDLGAVLRHNRHHDRAIAIERFVLGCTARIPDVVQRDARDGGVLTLLSRDIAETSGHAGIGGWISAPALADLAVDDSLTGKDGGNQPRCQEPDRDLHPRSRSHAVI